MSGYQDWTIKETIKRINEGKMFLPALQRKFVWKAGQIIELFDSILRGYPIGTFLFWNLKEVKNINEYSFYKFLNHYDEESNKHNELAPFPQLENQEGYYGVLDGQQRLSSLYLALQGTYKFKKSRERNAHERKLYVDLLKEVQNEQVEENDLAYRLDFWSDEEVRDTNNEEYWFEIKQVLTFDDIEKANEKADAIIDNNPTLKPYSKTIRGNLRKLFDVLCGEKRLINFYNVENKDLNEILDIFVRVNSGGTVLSKTDLLMSTIVVHWEEARNIFDEFVEYLNEDKKFKFTGDLIVRTALCLIGKPAKVEVKSFNSDTVKEIKENWEDIKDAIINMLNLLKSFGFTDSTMMSYLATIPISFYIYKGGDIKSEKEKSQIQTYITIALINQIFGRASNSVIDKFIESLNKKNSFEALMKNDKDKAFDVSEDKLEEILTKNRKDAYSLMILTLLYPEFKYEQIHFHQDHLHPEAEFKKVELQKQGKDWFEKRNSIPNLHILEGSENQTKSKTPLAKWAKDNPNFNDKFITKPADYDFTDFENFYENRKCNIRQELINKLGEFYVVAEKKSAELVN